MKTLIISIFWVIVFSTIDLGHNALHTISVDTYLAGIKRNENVRQHIEKLLLDLKQYESLDAESQESCDEIQESFVQRTLQEIPIDGVLRRIAEITLYMGEGCTRRAFEIGNRFLKTKTSLDTLSNCKKVDANCFFENEIRLSERMHQSLSVGFMYDVFAAAVYGSEHHIRTVETRVNNIIKETLGEEFSQPTVKELLYHKNVSRVRRHGCVDEEENRVQEVISWIPIIGTLYNLASSAVYGATGCPEVAKERAISGTIDLAMDLGTALTFGSGAAAFQGIKVASKIGIKAGLQAAKSAGKQIVKSQLKSMIKLYKNPIKGAIKETVDTVKSVVKIPQLVYKGGRRIYKTLSRKINKLDNFGETGNSAIKQIRCRRMINAGPSGGCNMRNIQEANRRSINRAPKYKQIFENVMNSSPHKQQKLDEMTTKEWARVLQQQTVGETFEFNRVIGGQHMAFKSSPSRLPGTEKQFLYWIKDNNLQKYNPLSTYNELTKSLNHGMTSTQRKQLAEAMLQEMTKTASDSIDFAQIVSPEKAKKASELIILTQIAEAVPGRTPGSDKDFRSVLRSIVNSDGEKSFHTTIMRGFPPATQGGTSLQRTHADLNTLDYNDRILNKKTRASNTSNRKKKYPNIDIQEIENARNFYSDPSDRRKRQTTH